ncbi:MAG: hypothetical protein GWP08_04030 [Nitrospiraceae bacterium]|nr:hypothetical protein [Nitrospiraceae bacterium]
MKLAFLFGAGISIPAGMPGTSQITEKVLSGEGITRHSSGVYYSGPPLDRTSVPRVRVFLNILKAECDAFYSTGSTEQSIQRPQGAFGRHETNYEDLYYVAAQIRDSEIGDHENPAIEPLLDKIEALDKYKILLEQPSFERSLCGFSEETCNYIAGIVREMLGRQCQPDELNALRLFQEIHVEPTVSNIDVFTLNHDHVFEQFCHAHKFPYVDGFGDPVYDVRYWTPSLFDAEGSRIRLFKLHGSINWFAFRPGEGRSRIGMSIGSDIERTKAPNGESQRLVSPLPRMLIGTFNKSMSYLTSIFMELHLRFYQSLRDTKAVVVAGYGFGDKGINTRLLEWVWAPEKRRLVVIEPNLSEDSGLTPGPAARGAIRRAWPGLIERGRLIPIRREIENVSWGEIRGYLDC